jgi:hypothetical protein
MLQNFRKILNSVVFSPTRDRFLFIRDLATLIYKLLLQETWNILIIPKITDPDPTLDPDLIFCIILTHHLEAKGGVGFFHAPEYAAQKSTSVTFIPNSFESVRLI